MTAEHDPTTTSHIDALTIEELEEAGGELHRRIAVALRRLGERRAEVTDGDGRTSRWRVASLAARVELTAATLGAVAAGGSPPSTAVEEHPTTVAAVMYAAPTLDALLARLEQDRRMLASLARSVERRLPETAATAWGQETLRRLLSEATIEAPARCAQALERQLAALEAAERAAAETAAGTESSTGAASGDA